VVLVHLGTLADALETLLAGPDDGLDTGPGIELTPVQAPRRVAR
jgi:hypothetical protein